MMMLIPVPGIGAGVLTLDGNLSAYIDRLLLPGRLYDTVMDPEGILSTIPAIATALLGAITGFFLKDEKLKFSKYKKGIVLLIGGIVLLLIAVLWNEVFPINKKMWTSSFVFCAGGISLIFLSVFYLIIDAFEYKKWAFPLLVIGMNSITIYLCQPAFNGFSALKDFTFSGTIHLFSPPVQPIIDSSAYLLTGWLILYFLYRNRIFLKV
jgi:predicted acyltransferase